MSSKKFTLALCILLFVAYHNAFTLAQISKQDWFGSYQMNHDGWIGTLTISSTQADCAESPWCDMALGYTDADGNQLPGNIIRMSPDWQEINFRISFTGSDQPFRGYIFSRDKNTIAGTTVWNNHAYGFLASKRNLLSRNPGVRRPERVRVLSDTNAVRAETPQAAINEIVKRQILDDGGIEHTFADGTRKIYRGGSIEIIRPDGTTSRMVMLQAMPLIPPALQDDSAADWFTALNKNMDELVGHLLKGDANSLRNYNNSLAGFKAAERINYGMRTVGFLID